MLQPISLIIFIIFFNWTHFMIWSWPPYLGLISKYNCHGLKQPGHPLQYHLQGHCQPEPRSQTTRQRNKELSNANRLILINTLKLATHSFALLVLQSKKSEILLYAYLVWTVILNGSLCKDPFITVIFSSLTPNQPFRFVCLEDNVQLSDMSSIHVVPEL